MDALVLPNIYGDYRRFDNWRDRNWYRALHAAGLAAAPEATAEGAFDPISLRHTCATVMFHAVKPGAKAGPLHPKEIARQLGHSVRVLHDVYEHIMDDDQHGLAGLTMDEIILAAQGEICG